MNDQEKKKIAEIVGNMECPKMFKCAESGFKNLCKAKDIGLEKYLECLEENPSKCLFALPFGYNHFCQCPLRVYLLKKMNK
jgi:hypothetical protein